ncbi:MAG TPA: GNAT family N-acetyltransferase [Gemmatimonadaceae bacterium]|nr:GNAT family N-acetyltransferase [Gemmatimonadaceae bacterium]
MTSSRIQARPDVVPGAHIGIRRVQTHAEYVACVELQMATWGAGFREIIPATMLKISQRLGGVTAGAFGDDGTLVGFIFGITGIERGEIVHWSDMLAVREDARNQGIGRRLKDFQRDAVRAVGATRMYWTFDPLVARNAHFNLNRLGARVSEYVTDMYGVDTGSALHTGVGTDRLIVVWPVTADGAPAASRPSGEPVHVEVAPPSHGAPVLNDRFESDAAQPRLDPPLPAMVRIEIPSDILAVRAESGAAASRCRAETRRAFQWALANGYEVQRFERATHDGPGHYLLTHNPGVPV